MTDPAPHEESALPLAAPMLLSFVAGYVDSYTYLALFGLFVAQVTSSFVIAGAELVTHDYNVTSKLLVTVVFIAAAALTAALIFWARAAGRATLPAMLWLEAALLAVFCAMLLFGPPMTSATDWHGIVAGLVAASAMGAQSVLVRLLMKGIPQTNVMTGNMTQLGIAVTELAMAWRKLAHSRHTPEDVRDYDRVRGQLLIVLSVAVGFLVGAAAGAVAFATTGLRGTVLAVLVVAALALWAFARERT
ncbi:MAG TPA: YoaK family protein [Xanthobacteraceae bacterium]|nr:YoaK family protein [Xanthobacteraceae bacterium]